MGNAGLYRKLLLDFRRRYADGAASMEADMRGGALEQASALAHTIKGVAGNIGAQALYECCRTLETALKMDRRDEADSARITFAAELARVIDGIARLEEQSQPATTTKTAADPAEIKAVTNRLAALLDGNDMGAMDLAEQLASMLDGAQAQDFAPIKQAVDRLDFDTAAILLTEFAIAGQDK